MMVLCRRDSSGFLNEIYYRCLHCGNMPKEEDYRPTKTVTAHEQGLKMPKLKLGNWRLKAVTGAVLATLAVALMMQIPVPVQVFAMQTTIAPVKDILPYLNLVNFTMSYFSFNYTQGQIVLRILADFASIASTQSVQNVTTSTFVLGKVLVNYQDSQRTLSMGFASLTLTVAIRYQDLVANIDATAYMPLWTAIYRQLTGQAP
jgi:hypothetical protein